MSDRCHCPPFIDGGVLRRQDCPHHIDRPPVIEPEPVRDPERGEMACAWADYRKDYGVPTEHMAAAHKAFLAGWVAARQGDQSGALR
jgi:hypothetical protein